MMCLIVAQLSLYLITKLQNLKAIHNSRFNVLNILVLYLITKLQNLKAIHNQILSNTTLLNVVSNYKITKSESYSQQSGRFKSWFFCCI